MHRPAVTNTPECRPVIEAQALCRAPDGLGGALLHPLDFRLMAGSQIALTGPSGSGKSVLLRTLALLDPVDSGTLLWNGTPVSGNKVPAYRSKVCYVSQRPGIANGTVEDNLRLPFKLKTHHQKTFDLSEIHTLLAKAGKQKSFLGKRAADLSGGEAQLMALVRALQLAPDVMLLDEPTSALDPASAAAVEALVLEWFAADSASRAFIWVSHDPGQAKRVSTQHLFMENSKLIAGAMR